MKLNYKTNFYNYSNNFDLKILLGNHIVVNENTLYDIKTIYRHYMYNTTIYNTSNNRKDKRLNYSGEGV